MAIYKLKSPLLISTFFAVIFFLLMFITISDYGVSWDETIHFRRGQAYLQLFLSGRDNYSHLPEYNFQGSNGDPSLIPSPRRSFYQNDTQDGRYFLNKDIGHPPLNGEMSAFFNYLFYQKLGLVDDITSHHLFNIFIASLLVFFLSYLTIISLGYFSSVVSCLTLVTYPLFFSEAHFNIKDPVETAFFTGSLLFFYLSITRKPIFILFSLILFGFGLGTKFNILFLPVIIVLYLIIWFGKYRKLPIKINRAYLLYCLTGAALALIIFLCFWPFLWQNPVERLFSILNYYKGIGTGTKYQPESFYFLGLNTFVWQWLLYTTPILTLLLAVLGLFKICKKPFANKIYLLILLWFFIPLIRVTLPNTSIYGGIRQVFEFVPAMAILTGIGAHFLLELGRKLVEKEKMYKIGIYLFLILLFIWPILTLINLHPHQNVYFNFLIGGLKGAQEKNFPSWGNSFGNAYKGGIEWINSHAPQNAKLALIQGTPSNAPYLWLRKDIQYLVDGDIDTKKSYFSGARREGEYLMELVFNDTGKDFYYTWEYIDKFLDPVYELKVDNVAILKIWKNDLEHTKLNYRLNELLYDGWVEIEEGQRVLQFNLDKEVRLANLSIPFAAHNQCQSNLNSFVETSLNGVDWSREKDSIPQYQIERKLNINDTGISFYFADRPAKYIRLVFNDVQGCTIEKPQPVIKIFE